jgi:hypothetical protein
MKAEARDHRRRSARAPLALPVALYLLIEELKETVKCRANLVVMAQ